MKVEINKKIRQIQLNIISESMKKWIYKEAFIILDLTKW